MIFTNSEGKLAEKPPILEIPENVITELTKESFTKNLENNNGLFIIKFGAEWCGPCKKADPLIYNWISKIQGEKIQCAIIDIDESFEIYAFLKNRKMVNGIPVVLCYYKGNTTYIPDDIVVGSDENQINLFFQRCVNSISL
jgi:thioredoxin 1